jgi:HAD superfamily hydrolase (TIGR01490 family)
VQGEAPLRRTGGSVGFDAETTIFYWRRSFRHFAVIFLSRMTLMTCHLIPSRLPSRHLPVSGTFLSNSGLMPASCVLPLAGIGPGVSNRARPREQARVVRFSHLPGGGGTSRSAFRVSPSVVHRVRAPWVSVAAGVSGRPEPDTDTDFADGRQTTADATSGVSEHVVYCFEKTAEVSCDGRKGNDTAAITETGETSSGKSVPVGDSEPVAVANTEGGVPFTKKEEAVVPNEPKVLDLAALLKPSASRVAKSRAAAITYAFASHGGAVAIVDGKVVQTFEGNGVGARAVGRSSQGTEKAAEDKKNAAETSSPASFLGDGAESVQTGRVRNVAGATAKTPPPPPRHPSNAPSTQKKPPVAATQVPSWIDAWSSGAPKAALQALKSLRRGNESDETTRAVSGTNENPVAAGSNLPTHLHGASIVVCDASADQHADGNNSMANPKQKETESRTSRYANPPLSFSEITNMAGAGADDSSETKKTQKQRCAFFDLDGTICASNVVFQFIAWRMSTLSVFEKILWAPLYAVKCAFYLVLDKISRTAFNNAFAKDFKGLSATKTAKQEMADVCFHKYLKKKVFPAAIEAIGVLKQQGFKVVLVTGSINFMIKNVVDLIGADHVIANELETELDPTTGTLKFSGMLQGKAVADDEKAVRILAYAKENSVDLIASRAYGDALADLQMLQAVGNPAVVSPKSAMRRIAEEEGWPVLQWSL